MLYDKVKFSDLFSNERQAVVCFLSLERRYMALTKAYSLEIKSNEEDRRRDEKARSDTKGA